MSATRSQGLEGIVRDKTFANTARVDKPRAIGLYEGPVPDVVWIDQADCSDPNWSFNDGDLILFDVELTTTHWSQGKSVYVGRNIRSGVETT